MYMARPAWLTESKRNEMLKTTIYYHIVTLERNVNRKGCTGYLKYEHSMPTKCTLHTAEGGGSVEARAHAHC